MVEHEFALLVGLDLDGLAGPALCTVGGRHDVDGAIVGKGQRYRIAGRERFLDGLVELRLGRRVLLFDVVVDVLAERDLGLRQQDSVLRTLGAGDGGHHVAEVELQVFGEDRFLLGVVPHALGLGVGLHQGQLGLGAPGEPQVVDGHLVDREDGCGGTEFGAHVAQRGAVGQRDFGDAFTVELDELAHHAVLAQHVGHGEHHVGGRHARLDLAGQLEPDDAGDEHRHRLTEHGRLGLDTADAPAQDAEPVDHRGVAVGAHTGVRVGHSVAHHDGAGQVFDVDLVHDSGARRHDLEVVEGALAPTQELIALAVAGVLDVDVAFEGVALAEDVHDHRVVDHHFGGCQRVDLVGVAAEVADRLAHGGQVDDAGHTGEVLHDHPGRGELDFDAGVGFGIPVGDGLDVVLRDVGTVLGAQQVLGQYLEAVGELLGAGDGVQPVDLVAFVADLQGVVRGE